MSENDIIKIRGARTHNLKNVDVDIPKHKLTVITGLSGSGKSSLAFDTIYAEGQRRYVESLSAYARQFLGLMDKPDVDLIEGLQPAISIDQKSTGHNPRSTVGTVTEIYDYLRLLFARVGHPRSPVTGLKLQKQTVQQIVDRVLSYYELSKSEDGVKVIIISPLIKSRKGTYEELFNRLSAQGFVRVRVDGNIYGLEEDIKLDKFVKHNIDLVVDRLVVKKDSKDDESFVKRLTDSIEQALNMGSSEAYINLPDYKEFKSHKKIITNLDNGDIFFSEKLVDPETGISFPEIEPHSFSFNSPHGACAKCNGLGSIKEVDQSLIYNPRLTISEGGIYPWARMIENSDSIISILLQKVSEEYGVPLRVPIGKLTPEQIEIILYGNQDGKKFKINHKNYTGEEVSWNAKFEGVITNLKRRYLETDSEYIRSEIEQYMTEKICPVCKGYRLRTESLCITIGGLNIVDVGSMSIADALKWINQIADGKDFRKGIKSVLYEFYQIPENQLENDFLSNQELEIGKTIFKEIATRLNFLISVGLEYLTLNRTARTLSGGESQRIRLASQIGTGLSGVLYVLDEPSIGLHQRDNARLIETLNKLKNIGNTVVVVEHDKDTIEHSDYIIDIGPGAGEHGGKIVHQGSLKELKSLSGKNKSFTADYLTGVKKIDKFDIYKKISELDFAKTSVLQKLDKEGNVSRNKEKIVLTNVTHNNLKGFDFELPLGKFVCVTGVSGSGKSSLVNDVVYRAISKHLYNSKDQPGSFKGITGLENIDKVIDIDQSPIGRTPRSNPATYTGVFTEIRNILSQTKEAKLRGYKAGRFSFNVKGGRCGKCQGAGVLQISMQFLPDVYVTCDECHGKRYNRETLQIDYKGKNISDILDMTIDESVSFFENVPMIKNKLKTLLDVGLGYIRLGQAATTLSGGESQRVKLASELSRRSTGKTLFILDEPTTGLHFEDVNKLLVVLHGLVARGNSVLVIEHNLDVIKTADWIVDMGPEGGQAGGTIIAQGTVKDIINTKESYTGEWLGKVV